MSDTHPSVESGLRQRWYRFYYTLPAIRARGPDADQCASVTPLRIILVSPVFRGRIKGVRAGPMSGCRVQTVVNVYKHVCQGHLFYPLISTPRGAVQRDGLRCLEPPDCDRPGMLFSAVPCKDLRPRAHAPAAWHLLASTSQPSSFLASFSSGVPVWCACGSSGTCLASE